MRTDSGDSGNGDNLRENAVDGVGMDKGNLQAEQAATRNAVDQLRARRCEIGQGTRDIVHLVRDVVHAGATLGEEPSHRRVFTCGCEQLDPAWAEPHRRCLDALICENLAMLELPAEKRDVGLDGIVEIGNRKTDVVNSKWLHAPDATPRRRSAAAA